MVFENGCPLLAGRGGIRKRRELPFLLRLPMVLEHPHSLKTLSPKSHSRLHTTIRRRRRAIPTVTPANNTPAHYTVPDTIVPAVNGTKSILETAGKDGYAPPPVHRPTLPLQSSPIKRTVSTVPTVGVSLPRSRTSVRLYTEEGRTCSPGGEGVW